RRACGAPSPCGYALGRPGPPALQQRVLRAAPALSAEPAGPVLRDFPDDAEPGDQPGAPPQASGIKLADAAPMEVAMEATQMRRYHEVWVERNGRTLLGLSGIPATRFRGVVRFLEEFAGGGDGGLPERSADAAMPNFIRYCADDLKTLYFEGHLAMKPGAGGEEIARWFWGETGAGRLLRQVRDRLDASDDPRWKAAAFGIAR